MIQLIVLVIFIIGIIAPKRLLDKKTLAKDETSINNATKKLRIVCIGFALIDIVTMIEPYLFK